MLKLKLQYFGHLMWRADSFEKTLMLGKIAGRRRRGRRGMRWLDSITDSMNMALVQFSSVQFSRSVVSDSLRPHELQHARPLCPSPTPGVDSVSCPSSKWCHPAISSSGVPSSSCPKSLPASGSRLWQLVMDHGVAKSQTWLSNWTELNWRLTIMGVVS